ncbi:MAG: heparinase II/III family protein [Gemmobacter sp.]
MAERPKATPVPADSRAPRFADRLHARIAGLARAPTGFVSQPEPRSIGMVSRGRQLLSGNVLLAGHLVELRGRPLWDVPSPDAGFAEAAHGFAWLDDLAAVADAEARMLAQDWVFGWIERFGRGRGPGWTPDLAGRRLIRWINHSIMLLMGREPPDHAAFFRSLGRQCTYLGLRWRASAPGLARFEALAGLIYAGLSLTGMERQVPRAVAALARDCATEIDASGGIATRNPEELLEVLTLLIWTVQSLEQAGRDVPTEIGAAIARIAPTLRSLRHADGGLARFHGGGRGLEGRLDHALAQSRVKPQPSAGPAMGFVRLSGGRTSVIVDVAPPPAGRASVQAHASTLAFELTSGRRPVVVNCGSGQVFGADWRRAGRATASHSTLAVEGFSSSRLGAGEQLADRAAVFGLRQMAGEDGQILVAGHSGWAETHGLSHTRALELSPDGRRLSGQDSLGSLSEAERRRFAAVLAALRVPGIRFHIRFHLHPEVDSEIDLGGSAVSLALRSGEVWVFRHDGTTTMTLEPSVYLEKGRLNPRPARQIVLTGTLMDYAVETGWTLAKAQDTPLAIRDLGRDDPVI